MDAREARRAAALGAAALLASTILLIVHWNLGLERRVARALHQDPRNRGVTLVAYHTAGVRPQSLTLNLLQVEGDKSPADVIRVLAQTASALRSERFGQVVLEHHGKAMFVVSGKDFASLGSDYTEAQSAIYIVRALPSELKRPDGSPAFGSHGDGGLFATVGDQLQDATTFSLQWSTGNPTADVRPGSPA